MQDIEIRQATADQAERLSALAMRSKAHWGYPETFMNACRDELRVSRHDIEETDCQIYVCLKSGNAAGYYWLREVTAGNFELDAMFVDPPFIGHGIGAALMTHCLACLESVQATSLIINSDPNAVTFYTSFGAQHIGEIPSGSVPGRSLPQLQIRWTTSSTPP